MSTKRTPQERIARALCRLLDDDWSLGRKLYMDTAAEIMADIGYGEMLAVLKAIHEQLIIQDIKFGPLIADAEAAIKRAEA